MTVGQPFNPFGLFNGIFIPEALLKAKSLSLGAKVVYGRLTRYAGQNGLCYPAVNTLATEIGLEVRQTRRYISELEEFGLIRRLKRFSGEDKSQTSNGYEFLGHIIFADSFKVTGGPRSDTTYPPRSDTTYKDSHVLRESRFNKNPLHLESFDAVGKTKDLSTKGKPKQDRGEWIPPDTPWSKTHPWEQSKGTAAADSEDGWLDREIDELVEKMDGENFSH